MNSSVKNIIVIVFILFFIIPIKRESFGQSGVHLFPDRSFCVSGDTIWFNTIILSDGDENSGNVVHVQLDGLNNQHIKKVSVLCENNRGHGYLPVPDSLSSGIYVLKSFLIDTNNESDKTINQKQIAVYNRFDKNIRDLLLPVINNPVYFESDQGIKISTDKDHYKTRDEVKVKIAIPEETCNNLTALFISAGISDPLSKDFSSLYIPVPINKQTLPKISVTENNGVLLSGKVDALNNNHIEGAIVLLSISDSIPYFDYCISDNEGLFYFYLKNARGTGNLVIQALSDSSENYKIEVSENYIGTTKKIESEVKNLHPEAKTFITDVINASYYKRIFTGFQGTGADTFSMHTGFKYPFYGKPTSTIYPEEFIELPDFTEISRELLQGVQLRKKDDETSVRLIDYGSDVLFTGEPLKLIDGIPVFDAQIFSSLGSGDLKKIDVVYYKRFFGGLAFNGVLAFYTKGKSIDWVNSIPGAGIFKYPLLQPEKKQANIIREHEKNKIPDFRNVFFHEAFDRTLPVNQINFLLSDISGRVAVRLIAVTKQNRISFNEKIIEVE
ncbi:MAG: hypothetical protein JW833_17415 [Prolixibacteraceae bacterium]|nr:hypothetical protein [Prolixibacteraceae bacterium]